MSKERKVEKKKHNVEYYIVFSIILFFNVILIISNITTTTKLETDIATFKEFPFSIVDLFMHKYPPASNYCGYIGVFFAWLSFYLFGQAFSLCLYSLSFIFGINKLLFKQPRIQRASIYLIITSFFTIAYSFYFDYNQDYSIIYKTYTNFLLGLLNKTGAILINTLFLFIALTVFLRIHRVKMLLAKLFEKTEKPLQNANLKNEQITTINEEKPFEIITKKEEENVGINFLNEENKAEAQKEFKKAKAINKEPEADLEHDNQLAYVKPKIENFLLKTENNTKKIDKAALQEEINQTCQILLNKLAEFDIEAKVVNVNIGPIITQYELQPAPGIKVNRFVSLADDLALAVKAKSIRVQAPIPGRGLIGIEIPNKHSDVIYLRDVLLSDAAEKDSSILSIGLGKDIAGRPIVTNLAKMPHLLIAGATGAGKSVCINTIIGSILFNTSPDEVRLVLIDPKRIELSGYEGIPHLIQNVVIDPDDAMTALNWAVYEMERRYELLQEFKVRDIDGYNQKINEQFGTEEAVIHKLPYIVLIVDEFADLIMTAGREIEMPITRLAQMARAIGIHLILATQRPSIKVITGVIKANFPARIAFRVSSKVDSRVILDSMGAEKLLGRGDMLFLPPGKANPERIHGAYISDSEIETLVEYLKTQPKPMNMIEMTKPELSNIDEFEYDDDLFPEAARLVVAANSASVSMFQRHFKIGYARAGRLIDLLERAQVVGPHVGSKPREVLMSMEDLDATEFNQDN
ncbi:MAG TPA: DNA translocase FtsK [Candidatus Cloacimonadota bacterium]|nr:DNA translocase FtsK [Candidatus Cloacimonadota bacterium]HOQ79438.1 DNA translocase FtsK [Candidatus Cloacimonadota bacterium]HPK40421.1 DNA translocase FtsK [Candidatus Cloacimonadota bacterium]